MFYISHSFEKEMKRLKKEWEMRSWKYDVDSYFRMKKMRELALKIGRDTKFYDDNMTRIRDRWPNVKNWD